MTEQEYVTAEGHGADEVGISERELRAGDGRGGPSIETVESSPDPDAIAVDCRHI